MNLRKEYAEGESSKRMVQQRKRSAAHFWFEIKLDEEIEFCWNNYKDLIKRA